MTDPEKATIGDLFRLMTEMRTTLAGHTARLDAHTGELRAAKHDLGQDIDAINARMTADKASVDSQFSTLRQELDGIRQDLSRHSTTTKSTLDSHTARFRTVDGKLDELKDQGRAIIDRLDRAHVPV